jgi:hypothetical protein
MNLQGKSELRIHPSYNIIGVAVVSYKKNLRVRRQAALNGRVMEKSTALA